MLAKLGELFSRIRYSLVRARVDDEARREFDAHLELLVDRYVRKGTPLRRSGRQRDDARPGAAGPLRRAENP